MTLEASVQVQVGTFDLDVRVEVAPGETVALLGPNGAGKSTVLRCLAGLVPIDAGRVVVDGRVLDDPGTGVFVRPEERGIGVVFQDYLLVPHLTALENAAFGLRARKVRAAPARAAGQQWLDRLGIGDCARRRPGQLSGGQAQRVALARALAIEPRVLLLDEPLAALDAGARDEVRRDLRRHLAEFPGMRVVITHDPVDAQLLADRVVVLEAGRIVQTGTLADVTARPASRYVADLVGTNLLDGVVARGRFTTTDGIEIVTADASPDGPAVAVVHPHAVALHAHRPEGSPRNAWLLRVRDLDVRGERVRVVLDGSPPLVAEVTAAAAASMSLAPGVEVWAAVKATEVTVSPR